MPRIWHQPMRARFKATRVAHYLKPMCIAGKGDVASSEESGRPYTPSMRPAIPFTPRGFCVQGYRIQAVCGYSHEKAARHTRQPICLVKTTISFRPAKAPQKRFRPREGIAQPGQGKGIQGTAAGSRWLSTRRTFNGHLSLLPNGHATWKKRTRREGISCLPL